MKRKMVAYTAAGVSLALLLGSCATTPQDCAVNQAARGAAIGAIAGGTIGGVGAALAGARSGTGLAIAAGVAVLGAAIGAAVGHHNDEVCHQMAIQQALDQAMAENQQAAVRQEHERVAYRHTARHSRVPTRRAVHHAVARSAVPEYQTVAWANSMTDTQGAITPIDSVAGPGSDHSCMTFDDTQTVDGQTKTVVGKACRGSDGQWKPVS